MSELSAKRREHTYGNGVCRCLGKCVTHNERGQVHVFPAENSDEAIDYFSDVEDYLDDQAERERAIAMAVTCGNKR